MSDFYTTAVVGAGMLGSCTARHSPCSPDQPAVLVGPTEAQNVDLGIFGAWFDQGRITRIFDKSPVWRELAKQSILRYRDIEQKSGIAFYAEVGFLSIVRPDYPNLEQWHETADILHKDGFACELLDSAGVRERFPYLNPPDNCLAYFQPDNSGYINPRKLVEAEQFLAEQNGFTREMAAVTSIAKLPMAETSIAKQEGEIFQLNLSNKRSIWCEKLVLATGAYAGISNLLQDILPEVKIDLILTGQTVAYLQVSEETAKQLEKMPCIVTSYTSGELDGSYILPPILYPDGQYYLKLGHGSNFENRLYTQEDVFNWYKKGNGDPAAVSELEKFINGLIPGLLSLSTTGGCCVTSNTRTKEEPLIQKVGEGVVVVGGGCGYAAKSCDQIGKIAAQL